MGKVTALFRHPIKAVGYEPLDAVTLLAETTFPGDRAWAVAHAASDADGADWAHCSKFVRGAKSPALMGVRIAQDGDALHLSHPDQPPLSVHLPEEADALIAWLTPLSNPNRPAPARVVNAAARGMTDDPSATISIMGEGSLTALSQRCGQTLGKARFRGNVWIGGLAPWEEVEWIGKTLRLGACEVEITERIHRCTSLNASPETGRPDGDVLSVLEDSPGEGFFGVLARVRTGGPVRLGDPIRP